MCLINELIKFNKIKHEYILLDEIGPAHKKTFFVTLKLSAGTENEESYTGIGSSIKKSQHAAAELALKQTKFKKPTQREKEATPNESNENQKSRASNELANNIQNKKGKKALTATVKLNALAMKLGLVASYTYMLTSATGTLDLNVNSLLNPKAVAQSSNGLKLEPVNNYTNFMNTNIYRPFRYQTVHSNISVSTSNSQNPYFNNMGSIDLQPNRMTTLNRPKQLFLVKLSFGNKEFNSEGTTLQIGKHNAAEKALEYYSNPENFLALKNLANSTQNKTLKAYRPPQFYKQQQSGKLF
jgi:hypothetical protein